MAGIEVRPLWAVRAKARAPRFALVAAAVVLAGLGLRDLFDLGEQPGATRAPAAQPQHLAARSLAEAFARAVLSGPADDARDELRAFGADFDSPVTPTRHRPRRVDWTAIVADRANHLGGRVVTVAVGVGSSTTYLAVTIAQDKTRRLYVAGPPAIVGPPPIADDAGSRPEIEVGDPTLRDAATRVVRHYLARHRQDLAADLDHGAHISLPSESLRVIDVEAVTWASRPRLVAVALVARARDGRELSLRYELSVVRRSERWLVRTVHINPLLTEAHQ